MILWSPLAGAFVGFLAKGPAGPELFPPHRSPSRDHSLTNQEKEFVVEGGL